jgi:hypothetical protein
LLEPNQPEPMPEVKEDMPQPLRAASSAPKAMGLAAETNALHTVCVTKPLSEHLPGLLRTVIPLPVTPRWRSVDDARRFKL